MVVCYISVFTRKNLAFKTFYRKSRSVLHFSVNSQPKVQERFSTLPKLWGNGSQGNKSWPKAKVVVG